MPLHQSDISFHRATRIVVSQPHTIDNWQHLTITIYDDDGHQKTVTIYSGPEQKLTVELDAA